jgi:membrane-bound lytic murein transglycosylase B
MRFVRARFFATTIMALSLAAGPLIARADATSDQQAQLQSQLDQINQEIAANQSKLATEQTQRATYENQVSILDSQIKEAQLEIQQRTLTLQQVQGQIKQAMAGISTLDTKVGAGEASLAQIMRETAEIDTTPLAEQILQGSLSEAFNEVDDFETLQKALGASFTQMAAEKSDLSARQTTLEGQQEEQQQLLQVQVLQQNSLKATEQQKQDLVTATRGQESVYQQIIASQQKTAAQIKAQLFSLNNASHSTSFGDMYQYSKQASVVTGVEPAFILAILTEESNLGQNVGNCTYESAMSPNRDVPDFLQIMQQLGLDPNSEKVSCAQSYGAYGGAMGPAQFIPSTWMLYQDRIATAAGQNPPNPWDPRTATFATAIYMSDLGADVQTPAAEREAALRYLAGSHWQNAAYAFYGEAVMNYTQQYEQNIAVLNGS